jgi:hypothetical protein
MKYFLPVYPLQDPRKRKGGRGYKHVPAAKKQKNNIKRTENLEGTAVINLVYLRKMELTLVS